MLRTALPAALALAVAGSALAAGAYAPHQDHARKVAESGGVWTVDNVRWGFAEDSLKTAVFRRAEIDPTKIAEVYYWSENFPPEWLAAHGMLAFVMKDDSGVVAADGSRAAGFVVSVEARLREGQKYSLLKGFGDAFDLVFMVTTLRDRLDFSVGMRGHSIDQFRLELDEKQKRDLVVSALETSTADRRDVKYHTTRNSCVSNVVRMVNTVLPRRQRMRLWTIPKLVANVRAFMPKFTYRYMMGKGVATRAGRVEADGGLVTLTDGAGAPLHRFSLRRLKTRPPELAVEDLVTTLRELMGTEAERMRLAKMPKVWRDKQPVAEIEDAIRQLTALAVDKTFEAPAVTLPFLLEQNPRSTPALRLFARGLAGRLQMMDPADRDALGADLVDAVRRRAAEFAGAAPQ